MTADGSNHPRNTVDRQAVARIEVTAFGVIYGSITVLALLVAMNQSDPRPLETAFILFGSVFCNHLGKGICASIFRYGTRQETVRPFRTAPAWTHSAPTLVAANIPTLLIVGSATEIYSFDTGIALAQLAAIWILGLTGYRMGWVIYGKVTSGFIHVAFTAAIGIALAVVKHIVH